MLCRDLGPHNRHGTYLGPVAHVSLADAAVIGNAAKTFSDGGHVEVPNDDLLLSPPAPYTVECWARPVVNPGTFQSPMGCRADQFTGASSTEGWNFYIHGTSDGPSSQYYRWGLWVGDHRPEWQRCYGPVPTLNVWTYLVGVVLPNGSEFYLDGELVATAAGTTWQVQTMKPHLGIGHRGDPGGGGAAMIGGGVDEAVVTPRRRTAGEIAARYALRGDADAYAADVLADDPLGYWRLDDLERGWKIGRL